MRRTILSVAALVLACQAALAQPPDAPPRGGPPIDEIATRLGLNDYQKTEMKRILEEAHQRMEASRQASMQQVDTELANVLRAEQLAEFKQMRPERRRDRRDSSTCTPPSEN